MKDSFHRALQQTLHHEGEWSDHPKDPGGATMKGVTLKTYSDFLGRPATKDELRKIPEQHLERIYRDGYWNAVRGDDLPSGLDMMVFDFAVNGGRKRAVITLQRAVEIPVAQQDGVLGPGTMAAVRDKCNRLGTGSVADTYSVLREQFYRGLPTFETFGKGWLRRNDAVLAMSKSWTDGEDSGKAYA